MKGSFSDGRYVFNFSKAPPHQHVQGGRKVRPARALYSGMLAQTISGQGSKLSKTQGFRAGTGNVPRSRRKSSELPGLGELDLDPQFDFRQHRVEPRVT